MPRWMHELVRQEARERGVSVSKCVRLLIRQHFNELRLDVTYENGDDYVRQLLNPGRFDD